MNPQLVVIIVALAIAAALFIWEHRRTSKVAAKVSAFPALLGTALADLKAHVTKEADSVKTRTATVGSVIVDKLGGTPTTAAKATLPIAGTTTDLPAPAAPAAPVAVEPPPATVAPAAPPAAPAPSVVGSGTEYPQVIEVDGIHLLADAPINPAWKLDVQTKAYDNAHSYGFEPSNGGKCNPPQPLRSPAGFPLFYALGADNAPVGAPRVLYGGSSYPDDAAVAAAIAAKASDDQAHDIAAAAAAAQVFAGPVPVSALTHADLQFLWWAIINPTTPAMHNWQFAVLSGSRLAIQTALSAIGNAPAYLNGYKPEAYQGVLRSYYDAAVKA